ncbi:MAG: primosomal protein N' [Desulfovibrio sp.]|nr:primosomal protein N' [Desulfovibrio sp.]
MFVRVVLLSAPFCILTYAPAPEFPEDFWRPGLRVAVPLGRGARPMVRAAMVLGASEESGLPEGVACKEICWPLEWGAPLIGGELFDLVGELARRQGVTQGAVLGHVLPAGLRSVQMRLHSVSDGRARLYTMGQLLQAGADVRLGLARDMARGRARILSRADDAADEELCRLAVDPPWPVRPGATRQTAVLEYLHDKGSVTRRRLLKDLGQGAGPGLKALLAAGYVHLVREGADGALAAGQEEVRAEDGLLPPPPAAFTLNGEQQAALDGLLHAFDKTDGQSALLYGVTGSGKTAVYLALARHCLAAGKSLLLLAPEVALALKLYRDACCALSDAAVFLYHGYQQPSRREAFFREMARRSAPCVVVGTRSALFLPLTNLACVILDEEHDASYKQDEGVCYQAKEVAWARMNRSGGLVVLGSATPDIKTFHSAEEGRLPLFRMPHRVGGNALPPVELVDIRGLAVDAGGGCPLAPESLEALRATVARGEQAVVLLNRRGYAPLMYCLDCGTTMGCPQCAIGMTYHKARQKLVCHYCGYTRPFPSPCPKCRGTSFLPMGEGTERMAETLATVAAGPVLRLDRDSTRRPGRMEEILSAFAKGESQVLVGTQMLSKGHHFPRVTLVVVADADMGLNLPDYRAAERTFQLLVQSSGRAGRGGLPGRVLLQTRDTNHYCWQYVRAADYEGFYAAELARRKLRRYPPFVCLGLLKMEYGMRESGGAEALAELARILRAKADALGVRLLGPAPAPLSLLRGRRRFQCLIKAGEWQSVRSLWFAANAAAPSRKLHLFLDLDPVNML